MNLEIENKNFSEGYEIIGGIDEAGRGPLAGPVVAACAVIKKGFSIQNEKLKQVRDSKKLTARAREELFHIIKEEFCDIGIGICDSATIDQINILQATFLAMKKSLGALKAKPQFILLDGKFPIPNFSTPQRAIIRGDDTVFTIAAASIIAKVTRDRLMAQLDKEYPQYGFEKHKGYGTKLHMEMIKKFGPSPAHRKSFKPVVALLGTKK